MILEKLTLSRCTRLVRYVYMEGVEWHIADLRSISQAFQRVWMLVMEFQHLRYKFELAVVGMKDGPASYMGRSALLRLQLLTAYKKDWPPTDLE